MAALTHEQFLILAASMKAVYTFESFLPDEDAAKVWYGLLCDIDYETLSMALKKYMQTSNKVPTPSDLRQHAFSLRNALPDDQSELAAWSMVRNAISNSTYNSEEEFRRLPPLIQKAVGNPANLREMAQMDIDTVNSVEQSHFLRSFRAVVNREKEMQRLSPDVRALIEKQSNKRIGTVVTPAIEQEIKWE